MVPEVLTTLNLPLACYKLLYMLQVQVNLMGSRREAGVFSTFGPFWTSVQGLFGSSVPLQRVKMI